MDVLKVKNASGEWISIPAVGPETLIPSPPTEDGKYILSLETEDGNPVYSWTTIPGEGLAGPYDEDPGMDGTASPGIAPEYARGDHVHPKDTLVLYFTSVSCSATSGNFASVSNASITSDHVLAECVFANSSAIITDVTWSTSAGILILNGTCNSATTVNIVLVKTSN